MGPDVSAGVLLSLLWWAQVRRLVCLWKGQCNPLRAGVLGAFRCAFCGAVSASLDEVMGFFGQGYVSPVRRAFTREPYQSKAESWEAWR
jgi:hypothetical protein